MRMAAERKPFRKKTAIIIAFLALMMALLVRETHAPNAAGEAEATLLRAQGCNLEDSLISQTFSQACAGTYPGSSCGQNDDRLSCNDSINETSTVGILDFGGVNITAYNNTIFNCVSVTSARICHNWYTSTSGTYGTCRIGTDNDGDLTWTTTAVSCPTTTSSMVCTDVTGQEGGWACGDFFGTTPSAWAYVEAQRTDASPAHSLDFDVLYFNITYEHDNAPPNNTILAPLSGTNISGRFLINASVNDTLSTLDSVNLSLLQPGAIASGPIAMNLSSGNLTSGYFNVTLDSATVSDGRYNLSVNATDSRRNTNTSANISIMIDNTKPNATIVAPQNGTAVAYLQLINASVNDSSSGISYASFMLVNSSSNATGWLQATLGSGSIYEGYWNITFDPYNVRNSEYNITINSTDFAGNQLIANISSITVNATPDLTINTTDILFLNFSPLEGQNITINATVRNIGRRDAAQFVVEFFEGFLEQNRLIMNTTVPSLAAGSSIIVNTTYLAKPGPNNIHVRLDWNNSINETNETNNQANNTMQIDGHSYYFGNSSISILLGTASNTTIYTWLLPNSTGSLFAADADSSLDFTALQALGRKTSGDISSADFQDADSLLNMTNFTDSLSNLYTTNGITSRKTKNFTIFGTPLANVSVTNSTNSTDFETGILWDTSKDTSSNSEYDPADKEPLVFITDVALPKNGRYGYYSYEIRVPALLRRYVQPNNQNSLAFYAELT